MSSDKKRVEFWGLQPWNAQQQQIALPIAVGISSMQSEDGEETMSAIHVTVLFWTFAWIVND